MQKSSQKTSKSKGKGLTDSLVWSDDEVELLLKVTHEYKVSRVSENIEIRPNMSGTTPSVDRRHVYANLWPSAP